MRYTFRRTLIVHWFNGLFAYELQVGPVIMHLAHEKMPFGHGLHVGRFRVCLDRYWRQA